MIGIHEVGIQLDGHINCQRHAQDENQQKLHAIMPSCHWETPGRSMAPMTAPSPADRIWDLGDQKKNPLVNVSITMENHHV